MATKQVIDDVPRVPAAADVKAAAVRAAAVASTPDVVSIYRLRDNGAGSVVLQMRQMKRCEAKGEGDGAGPAYDWVDLPTAPVK